MQSQYFIKLLEIYTMIIKSNSVVTTKMEGLKISARSIRALAFINLKLLLLFHDVLIFNKINIFNMCYIIINGILYS